MEYQDLPRLSHAELYAALSSPATERAAAAVISVGLHEPDWRWAEQVCLEALKDAREEVRAAAVTSLGHIARVHGRITALVVIPVLESILTDPALGGVAEDALEDIRLFAKGGETGSA